MGVQQFYAAHGSRYTNPHEGQIFAALCQLLDATPAAVWLGLRELQSKLREGQGERPGGPQRPGLTDQQQGAGEEEDGEEEEGEEGEAEEDEGGAHGSGHVPAAAAGYRPRNVEEAAAIAAAVTAGLAAPVPLRVLDLACGSGEASACLLEWNQQRPLLGAGRAGAEGTGRTGAAAAGAAAGAAGTAATGAGAAAAAGAGAAGVGGPVGASAGGGKKSKRGAAAAAAPLLPYELRLTACDPYTRDAYVARTGRTAESWSFEDIADGCIDDHLCYSAGGGGGGASGDATAACAAGQIGVSGGGGGGSSSSGGGSSGVAYDLVVCSFALHLCEATRLYGTLTALARSARWLLVLAPHKLPHVRQEHGWRLARSSRVERTHVRLYRSLAVPAAAAAADEAAA
ncbi:hypothetical protein HXX76_002328 [Chlamydomonas incerta]|uniref:Uncharacterized protein n=1 Tax=Chlamydomonas incerta TaxID=51695 RepID=A0A835VRR7_CHLIN|nr:hypothetical protein HXX76_002328 [Chlamydomonas incerta]|eukprot:KAG2423104.1 hypothetical protein HXX76_002328 [Chlamydomonas incerta]